MPKKQNMIQSVLTSMMAKSGDPFMPGGKQFYVLPAGVSPAAVKEKEVKENMRKGKGKGKGKGKD
jgi:hypothetical protein